MTADNSTGPRNYYEDQFGDRIRNIAKGGGTSPPRPPAGNSEPSTGSGSGFGRGAGFLIVFVVIGLLRAVLSSNHRHTPPVQPPPRIQIPEFQAPVMDPELGARWEEFRLRIQENKDRALGAPPVDANLQKAGLEEGKAVRERNREKPAKLPWKPEEKQ